MCCFSTATEVYGTRIFARMTNARTQMLAYQMSYRSRSPTAMILPVPVATPAREDSLRFKNLKGYPQFFHELASGFPQVESFSLSRSKSASAEAPASLAVQEVGDYIASFVPSVGDFKRVDPQFVIRPDVWAQIPAYKDYGFAVFQLKDLSGTPHPMAFEFDTAASESVFFPTVHIHDGTVHAKDDFDHVLYVQSGAIDARVSGYDGPDAVDRATGLVRSKSTARTFVDASRAEGLLEPELLVHKMTLRGSLPNRDTFVDLKRIQSASAAGCGRCDVVGASPASFGSVSVPVALGALGFGFIVKRRNALRRAR